MGSIRLHPQHGVNPSLDLCFWCGKERGVALLGYNKGKEAPRSVVTSYDPCDTCKSQMAQGITILEAEAASRRPNVPEIQPGVVPTGRWLVMREDALEKVFSPNMVETLKRSRKAFVEAGPMFEQFLPDDQQGEASA